MESFFKNLHWHSNYTSVYTFIITDQTLPLKYTNFIICKLYLIEIDFFNLKDAINCSNVMF